MLKNFKRGFNTQAITASLQTKKVADLKVMATGCGVLVSGNKPQLIDRLATHLASPTQSLSIVSFDLGYRNLAYCHLSADKTVLDWARVDLDLPSFHPSVMAPIVRQFISDRVLKSLKVADRVLVEQQRARSAGSLSVLEHTLRVNCVEAILWCGLYESIDSIERSVDLTPVLRQSVDRVWKDELQDMVDEMPEKFIRIKRNNYRKKQAGTMMVQKWLDTDTVIKCSDHFKEMYAMEKKKDDLSDCLVQALTWYQWESYSKSLLLQHQQN